MADWSKFSRDSVGGLVDAARKHSTELSQKISAATTEASEEYKISERIGSVRKAIDEQTPDFVRQTGGRISESVDVITGSKLLDVVQEMVSLQEQYNDVLAAKLEEALQRIAALESSLVGRNTK